MRTIKPILLLLLILIIFFACSDRNNDNRSIVCGRIYNLPEGKIYLKELDIRDIHDIDSVRPNRKGGFSIEAYPEEAGFYLLVLDEDNRIPLILNKNDTVRIAGDYNTISFKYDVSGSKESVLLKDYIIHTRKNERIVDSLVDVMKQYRSDPEFEMIRAQFDRYFDSIFQDQQNYVRNFIDNNPGTLASLLVLNQGFGRKKLFDEKEDLDYFLKLDSALMTNYPGNKHTIDHHDRIIKIQREIRQNEKSLEKLKPGNKAPDFSMNDINGNTVSLNELKGKVVLIYFWASWSAKSRQINRKLIDLYHNKKDDEFEVLAVSLDIHGKMWEGAVNLDNLDWINVNDMKGYSSPVKSLYQVPDKLPFFCLVDKEGVIVYRGDDYSLMAERLESVLSD